MNFWIILNGGLGIAVALVIVIKLHYYSDKCHWIERVGMSAIAAAMVLNMGPLLAQENFPFGENSPTPFDDWASAMLRVGLLVYFTTRIYIHYFANAEMKNQMRGRVNKAKRGY